MINRKFTLIGIIVASSYGLFATGHMEAIDPRELNPEETPEVTKEHAVTQEPNNKLEGIARSWMEAYYTSKEAWSSAIKFHLDESGESVASRYVGFGFGFDPNQETGRMLVTSIVPNSPASEVLKVGDEFLTVNGMRVNKANLDRLPFRGKPGENVRALIKRDGKNIKINVSRGVISGSYSKEQILNNIQLQEAEDWSPIESNIIETLSKENIVYVLHWAKRIDDTSKLPYEAYGITRFTFNEEGKIQAYGSLGEDRFILEQQGYKISR